MASATLCVTYIFETDIIGIIDVIDIDRVPLRSVACQVANSLTPVDCIIGTHTSSSVGIMPAWGAITPT